MHTDTSDTDIAYKQEKICYKILFSVKYDYNEYW